MAVIECKVFLKIVEGIEESKFSGMPVCGEVLNVSVVNKNKQPKNGNKDNCFLLVKLLLSEKYHMNVPRH